MICIAAGSQARVCLGPGLSGKSKQAHDEVTQRAVLDDAWQKKIARAQAELTVRKYKEQELRKVAPKQARVIRRVGLHSSRPIYVLGTNRWATRTWTLSRLTLVLATSCRGRIDDAA